MWQANVTDERISEFNVFFLNDRKKILFETMKTCEVLSYGDMHYNISNLIIVIDYFYCHHLCMKRIFLLDRVPLLYHCCGRPR